MPMRASSLALGSGRIRIEIARAAGVITRTRCEAR
jgi:hypothetical protein